MRIKGYGLANRITVASSPDTGRGCCVRSGALASANRAQATVLASPCSLQKNARVVFQGVDEGLAVRCRDILPVLCGGRWRMPGCMDTVNRESRLNFIRK
ncbi:MAG: hypothetical protein ACYDBH_00760 [Acidobacteriaceae bacterium]